MQNGSSVEIVPSSSSLWISIFKLYMQVHACTCKNASSASSGRRSGHIYLIKVSTNKIIYVAPGQTI